MDLEPSADPKALVDAIRGPSPTYKREALDAIVARREETTPHLLAILQEILDDPHGYLDRVGDGFDHLYALVLLAHFRESRAHDLIVRIAQLPEPILDKLLGDFHTEDLPDVLLLTCGGQTEGIRALLLDRDTHEYSRIVAALALVMAVGLGYAQRDEVLSLLASQFVPEAAPPDSYFWAGVVGEMLLLHPIEHKQALQWAFDEGLITAAMIRWSDIESELAKGPEAAAKRLAERCQQAQKGDIHDWLSWWGAFQQEEDAPKPAPRLALPPLPALPFAPWGELELTRSKKDKDAKKARKRQRAARKAQRKKR